MTRGIPLMGLFQRQKARKGGRNAKSTPFPPSRRKSVFLSMVWILRVFTKRKPSFPFLMPVPHPNHMEEKKKKSTFIQINCHVFFFLVSSFKLYCIFILECNYESVYLRMPWSKWSNTINTVVPFRKKVRLTGTDCYWKPTRRISKIQETISLKKKSKQVQNLNGQAAWSSGLWKEMLYTELFSPGSLVNLLCSVQPNVTAKVHKTYSHLHGRAIFWTQALCCR